MGGKGVSGFVDAEFEGHSASELVSLIICGDVGCVDSAFHIHLHVGGHIQELHSHQGLCVVHLGQRRRVRAQAHSNLASSSRTLLPLRSHHLRASHRTYVELFAIVGEVHEVDVAIGREHDKAAQIFSIFISLWGYNGVEGELVKDGRNLEACHFPLVFLPQIILSQICFPCAVSLCMFLCEKEEVACLSQ